MGPVSTATAMLLILAATALLACQSAEAQDRPAAIEKLKEAVAELYPDEAYLMLRAIDAFTNFFEAEPLNGVGAVCNDWCVSSTSCIHGGSDCEYCGWNFGCDKIIAEDEDTN